MMEGERVIWLHCRLKELKTVDKLVALLNKQPEEVSY